MLKKVVVFDNGFGGELFADYIEKEIPIIEPIRVIDWRNSASYYGKPRAAQEKALKALRPYINRSDIIIVSNQLVSLTSLKKFQRKFPKQKFTGLVPHLTYQSSKKRTLIITTKSTRGTISYRFFKLKIHSRKKEFECDKWAQLIDEGEEMEQLVIDEMRPYKKFAPQQIILFCSHLMDIKPILRKIYGPTVAIIDGYKNTITDVCRELGIRGGIGCKNK